MCYKMQRVKKNQGNHESLPLGAGTQRILKVKGVAQSLGSHLRSPTKEGTESDEGCRWRFTGTHCLPCLLSPFSPFQNGFCPATPPLVILSLGMRSRDHSPLKGASGIPRLPWRGGFSQSACSLSLFLCSSSLWTSFILMVRFISTCLILSHSLYP